jgi:hypothetical protein
VNNSRCPIFASPFSLLDFRFSIDAGFYDNFGVHLASLWLLRHLRAIEDFTSGVVVIEIRAFRYGTTRRYFLDPHVEDTMPEGPQFKDAIRRRTPDRLAQAVTWASRPSRHS